MDAKDHPPEDTDEQQLQTGIRKHRATTESARNAAQIAARTQDVAKATLVDLKGQGEQIERMHGKYEEVEHQVDRAESILSWFDRCCWCCCCRRDEPTPLTGWGGKHYKPKDGKAGAGERAQVKLDARDARHAEATRAQPTGKTHVIGNGLDGKDGETIREESRAQDDYLDNIALALTDIKGMSTQMQSELERQHARLDDVQGNNDHVQDRITQIKRNKHLRKYG